jgi:hypothetical protein
MDANFTPIGKFAVNPAMITAIDFSHEGSATVIFGNNAVTLEGDDAAALRKQYWKEDPAKKEKDDPAKPAHHGDAAEGDTGNPAQTSSRYGATPQTQKK